MSAAQLDELFKSADACLNVCGSHQLSDEHRVIPARLYVESDPFASQVRCAKGDAGTRAFLDAHTHFFTFGENIGKPGCGIPSTGHAWMPTRQPVHLPLWSTNQIGGSKTFTTITTWHNRGEPLEWQGDHYYWTKDREFMKVIDLPGRLPIEQIRTCDWRRTRPWGRCCTNTAGRPPIRCRSRSTPARTASYIQQSRGEFTVARDQYARPRTGWSSDRSVCYLAAGRPVITGDTGFGDVLPTGRGLFAFKTTDDVIAAVESIERDYAGHCEAARAISPSNTSSADKVLASLMGRAGLM